MNANVTHPVWDHLPRLPAMPHRSCIPNSESGYSLLRTCFVVRSASDT